MARLFKTIYVKDGDGATVDQILPQLKALVPSLDWDQDWDKEDEPDPEGEDRCDWCIEHGVENCRHMGM